MPSTPSADAALSHLQKLCLLCTLLCLGWHSAHAVSSETEAEAQLAAGQVLGMAEKTSSMFSG